jgi:tRNA-specific 2-thiouridylase
MDNMKKKKVMVAMSGGVDSAVAAALIKEQGFEVEGVTMDIFSLQKQDCDNKRSCCGRGAIADANRVAAQLGIPHYVVNLRKPFQDRVVENFCAEYASGKTPNPCIRCNQYIKFDVLWKWAEKAGADYLATGHHARVKHDESTGKFQLRKGKDSRKDQSYFLYTMTQEQLSRTLMPIGHFKKKEIRDKAERIGLAVHKRPESQEICFVPDDDYSRFLREKIPEAFKPGSIVDGKGCILGQHKGILHFTIGQRRGLRIAASHPLYVCEIHPASRTIVVGSDEYLYKKKVFLSHLNLISGMDISIPTTVMAKIRYKHREARARLLSLGGNKAQLDFATPQRAVTPGQSAVFYNEDVVLGGGIIEKADA